MLQYCSRCLYPDTKPDLVIDAEGVCSACRHFERRPSIDWEARRNQFSDIVERYRQTNEGGWDCLVPVSGGKDSTFQVIRLLEFGVNPLCVAARTCDFSAIGRENLDNIRNLGVDLIEFAPNPVVRRKLNRIGLRQVGDIAWPEHVGIFTIPVRAAIAYRVPLIIWGENSQDEYGGPAAASENNYLDRQWLEEFGGLLGQRVSDLIGMDGLRERDLLPYRYPDDDELRSAGVTGLFLGYFFPWDGLTNALVAAGFGFKSFGRPTEGSFVDYENLDNHQHGIHDYFKFLKFGFARATDQASLHIRRGRLERRDALTLVRDLEGKFPWSYLDKPLEQILEAIKLSIEEFRQICDRFTNHRLFVQDEHGELHRGPDGSLTKVNYDNP